MNGFLDRMVHNSLGMREKLLPRVPSVFEPQGVRVRIFGEEESGELNPQERRTEVGSTDDVSKNRTSDFNVSDEHSHQKTSTAPFPFSPTDNRKDEKPNRKTGERTDLLKEKRFLGGEQPEALQRSLANPLNPHEESKISDVPKELLGKIAKESAVTPPFSMFGLGNHHSEKKPKKLGDNALIDFWPKQVDQRPNDQEESFLPEEQPTFRKVPNPPKSGQYPTQPSHQDLSEQRPANSPSTSRTESKEVSTVSETKPAKFRKIDVEGLQVQQESIRNTPRPSHKNTDGLHKDIRAMKAALSGLKSAMHVKPAASESTVHVSIGRVEVKAVPEKPSSRKMIGPRAAVMPLQDYLAFRAQGKIG